MSSQEKPVPPTCEELLECEPELFTRVDRQVDDTWVNGAYVTDVYRRLSDDTYWIADYRRSTGGKINELRSGEARIRKVVPKHITRVQYVEVVS